MTAPSGSLVNRQVLGPIQQVWGEAWESAWRFWSRDHPEVGGPAGSPPPNPAWLASMALTSAIGFPTVPTPLPASSLPLRGHLSRAFPGSLHARTKCHPAPPRPVATEDSGVSVSC